MRARWVLVMIALAASLALAALGGGAAAAQGFSWPMVRASSGSPSTVVPSSGKESAYEYGVASTSTTFVPSVASATASAMPRPTAARASKLRAVATAVAAEDGGRVVIGKLGDLGAEGAIGPGERTLLDQLPDQGSEAANWAQNRAVVLKELESGQPIRDASVNAQTGALENNTGFLARERGLLQEQGWQYDPGTRLWSPGGGGQ